MISSIKYCQVCGQELKAASTGDTGAASTSDAGAASTGDAIIAGAVFEPATAAPSAATVGYAIEEYEKILENIRRLSLESVIAGIAATEAGVPHHYEKFWPSS